MAIRFNYIIYFISFIFVILCKDSVVQSFVTTDSLFNHRLLIDNQNTSCMKCAEKPNDPDACAHAAYNGPGQFCSYMLNAQGDRIPWCCPTWYKGWQYECSRTENGKCNRIGSSGMTIRPDPKVATDSNKVPTTTTTSSNNSSTRKYWIIFLVIGGICVIGGVAFYMNKKRTSEQDNTICNNDNYHNNTNYYPAVPVAAAPSASAPTQLPMTSMPVQPPNQQPYYGYNDNNNNNRSGRSGAGGAILGATAGLATGVLTGALISSAFNNNHHTSHHTETRTEYVNNQDVSASQDIGYDDGNDVINCDF